MGRTVPPMMMVIEQEAARWTKFRRALRKEDQLILDELFLLARKHVQAAAYASDALPFEALLLAMLIEVHKIATAAKVANAALATHAAQAEDSSKRPAPKTEHTDID